MAMSWELLLLRNIPRMADDGGNDNGGNDNSGGEGPMGGPGAGYGGDAGSNFSASDSSGTADMGGGPGTMGGVGGAEGYGGGGSYSDAVNDAAANIANTSGGPEAAAANAAATGNADIADAVAGMIGGDTGRSASSISASESASVSPTTTSSIASVAAGMSPSVSLGYGYGGFSSANVSQGLAATGVAGLGAPSISSGLGSLTGLGGLGTSPAAVTGTTGLAELGDTGPQGFSTSGFAPSSTAPDVSQGMAAVGMPADQASFAADMSNVGSSLAQAAATPAEGLSDIGIADPSGLGTGFTGFGTGTVSISPSIDAAVQAVSTFGAQNVGAYSMPGYSTPAASVSMPTGNQAFSVGYAGTPSVTNVAAQDVAAQRSGITSLSAQQLSDQLNSMTQPSALSNVGATPTAPAVSSYGFSGMTSAGLPGIAGLAGAPAPTSSSSLATAAAVSPSTSTRSASSMSEDSFNDPLTGAPVSVTNINGEETYSVDSVPTQSGIASIASHPVTSALVNAGLAAAIPGYGPASLATMGLTGTSLYGQAVSLASGQGLQTGGGLMGLASGAQQTGQAPAAGSYGGESGGSGNTLVEPSTTATPYQQPVQSNTRQGPSPIVYDIANFLPRETQPVSYVPTYSPSFPSDYLAAPRYRA